MDALDLTHVLLCVALAHVFVCCVQDLLYDIDEVLERQQTSCVHALLRANAEVDKTTTQVRPGCLWVSYAMLASLTQRT